MEVRTLPIYTSSSRHITVLKPSQEPRVVTRGQENLSFVPRVFNLVAVKVTVPLTVPRQILAVLAACPVSFAG